MKGVIKKGVIALSSGGAALTYSLTAFAQSQVIIPSCPLIPETLCELEGLINVVLKAILAVVGLIALIYLVIGGLRYITSSGNPDAVEGAKNQILYAIIGIIVVVLAWALVTFVLNRLFPSAT